MSFSNPFTLERTMINFRLFVDGEFRLWAQTEDWQTYRIYSPKGVLVKKITARQYRQLRAKCSSVIRVWQDNSIKCLVGKKW
jgi:hypothetical protein